MGDQESQEDGRQRRHRLLHAAQVQHREHREGQELDRELLARASAGGRKLKIASAPPRDRDGDGEHVVDEQRAAGEHARGRPEQLGGDDVAAAAGGEVLDDPRVGVAMMKTVSAVASARNGAR